MEITVTNAQKMGRIKGPEIRRLAKFFLEQAAQGNQGLSRDGSAGTPCPTKKRKAPPAGAKPCSVRSHSGGVGLSEPGLFKQSPWGEISIVLVDDKGSREVNAAHLGHDYPTDVISFNYDHVPGVSGTGLCGEIVVNVQQAIRTGARWQGTAYELALYLAHGCDHLAGEDDATPAQRRRMRRRELRWLAMARKSGFSLEIR